MNKFGDPKTWPEKTFTCMVHRYLYYCMCSPVISDYTYDELEREASKEDPDGPLSVAGCDYEPAYPQEIKDAARKIFPKAPFEE